ncbi:TPA: hypothetical protein ACH3X1_003656 [Trebouxia sp. C0004]
MANADKGKQVLGMPASQGTGAGLGPLTPAAKLSVAAGSKRSSTPLSKSCNKRPATKVAAPTGAQPYLTGRVISSLVVTSKNQSRSNSLEFVSRADGRVHHIHTSPPKEAVSVVKRESSGRRPLKAHRKAVGGLLASLMSQIMGGVAKDRGLEACQIAALMKDKAPLEVKVSQAAVAPQENHQQFDTLPKYGCKGCMHR